MMQPEDKIQEIAERAERLQEIGSSILRAARDELYLGMRFLDVALSSFSYQMDGQVHGFGTDGRVMYFQPQMLGGLYRENRILVNRGYLHMVFHCIFRHFAWSGTEGKKRADDGITIQERMRDLSCDIAVEHMIDGMNYRSIRFSRSLLRRETYRLLEKEGKTLNAQRVYKILSEWNLNEKDLTNLEQEFRTDRVRMPAFIVVVASFVTVVQLLLQGFIPSLYDSLGIYIPLIVVNCIILGRAEAYASKNKPIASLFDGIGMGLGFTLSITCIGAVRELIGAGSLFGHQILPLADAAAGKAGYEPITIFILAPGAFFVLAALSALQNKFKIGAAKRGIDPSNPDCGGSCAACGNTMCKGKRG